MKHALRLSLAALLLAAPAAAQHAGHGHAAGPYAGFQEREIRALSPAQIQELRSGAGMAMALPAELNGWPGPAHVLELAEPLGLTAQQREASEALATQHRARAVALGEQVIEAERALDRAFSERSISPEGLDAMTARIGALQAALRAEHLRTHLAQTALLTPAQIRRYDDLRGYAAAGHTPPAGGHGAHHHR